MAPAVTSRGTDNVVWTRTRGTPYVPSPLLYEDTLYFLRHYQGILSRVHGPTGEEELGPFRLGRLRNIYSSPVAAGGRIYVTDRMGQTLVVSHEDPQPLALNVLDDTFNASAAVAGDTLFLSAARGFSTPCPSCLTTPVSDDGLLTLGGPTGPRVFGFERGQATMPGHEFSPSRTF